MILETTSCANGLSKPPTDGEMRNQCNLTGSIQESKREIWLPESSSD